MDDININDISLRACNNRAVIYGGLVLNEFFVKCSKHAGWYTCGC